MSGITFCVNMQHFYYCKTGFILNFLIFVLICKSDVSWIQNPHVNLQYYIHQSISQCCEFLTQNMLESEYG